MTDSFVIYKVLACIKFLQIIVIFPPQTFTWGESQNRGGGGRTLNAEVIGMLVGNVFGKPLKIPKLLAQYPKKYKFYLKLFGNFSFLLDMEDE